MATVNLVTKFLPHVDEQFKNESKRFLLTNRDFDWAGAHTVKVYKITTSEMNDYDRAGTGANASRYGAIAALDAVTEEMTLSKDRSFTFAIDKLDEDETAAQLQAASALARQNREVVIPEVDAYVYGKMIAGAGSKPAAAELTDSNIYDYIIAASSALDDSEVPEVGRVLLVTPYTYLLMKRCSDIVLNTEIGADMRIRGVIANLDGMQVIKVPANRVPAAFGFMIAHPVATVAPVKLEDFKIHRDPPGISGALVEGRICYDAFVLDNKACAIYYQAFPALGSLTVSSSAGTASGDTAITITESKGSGNVYVYKVGTAAETVAVNQDVSSWTAWDGTSDITAATGKKITVVEATADYRARKAGNATVTAHA